MRDWMGSIARDLVEGAAEQTGLPEECFHVEVEPIENEEYEKPNENWPDVPGYRLHPRLIRDSMPDEPKFEKVGSTEDGYLYEMNSLDVLIYMQGLRAIQEEKDAGGESGSDTDRSGGDGR